MQQFLLSALLGLVSGLWFEVYKKFWLSKKTLIKEGHYLTTLNRTILRFPAPVLATQANEYALEKPASNPMHSSQVQNQT